MDDLIDTRKMLYYTVHSPSFETISQTNTPSDPTAKAVNRIIALDEKIEVVAKEYTSAAVEVLEWLYSLGPEDVLNLSQFRSIVICHYLRGMPWETVARTIFQTSKRETPKKRIYTYFKDHPEG